MRSRHILYPPHPNRIVDMAEFVDVIGDGGEGEGVGHEYGICYPSTKVNGFPELTYRMRYNISVE
jgi:hypothetical protein